MPFNALSAQPATGVKTRSRKRSSHHRVKAHTRYRAGKRVHVRSHRRRNRAAA